MKDQITPKAYNAEAMKALWQCADDIAVVLRSHFIIEQAALVKVEEIVPDLNRVMERPKLSHAISILRYFEVPEHFWRPLKELDKIRHKFAHEGIDVIGRSEVDSLLNAVRPEFRSRFGDGSIAIVKGGQEEHYSFDQAPVRELFSMIVSTLLVEVIALSCVIEISHSPFSTRRKISWTGIEM
ncbi:hypothetical protein [Marinicauda pacifica]|uniref:hypothetical protein n=1 Tax=Marinicauda pacifica TaxID=1133559 RepID=UPI0035C81AEE